MTYGFCCENSRHLESMRLAPFRVGNAAPSLEQLTGQRIAEVLPREDVRHVRAPTASTSRPGFSVQKLRCSTRVQEALAGLAPQSATGLRGGSNLSAIPNRPIARTSSAEKRHMCVLKTNFASEEYREDFACRDRGETPRLQARLQASVLATRRFSKYAQSRWHQRLPRTNAHPGGRGARSSASGGLNDGALYWWSHSAS